MRVISVLIFLLFLILLAGCGGGSSSSSSSFTPTPERIEFPGIGHFGIFDPAIAKSPDDTRLWMSYSHVELASHYDTTGQFAVGIRLAYSDDAGHTWTDAGVNLVDFIDVTLGDVPTYPEEPSITAGTQATWMSEVSSLVYDPGAPSNERWKLIWHQFLKANQHTYFFSYGWLAMKAAATPMELASAPAIKLFSGLGLRAESELAGDPSYAPIGGSAAIALNSDLNADLAVGDVSELSQCVFTEPGLLATNDALYLALDCHSPVDIDLSYTPLLKCASPCDMTDSQQWQYLGGVVDSQDAQAIDRVKLNAPQLFESGGDYYIILTPVDDQILVDRRYDGCNVYRFENIDLAQLQRQDGELVSLLRVAGEQGSFNGACTAHQAVEPGIFFGQVIDSDPPAVFRLFQSFLTLP